MKDRIEIHSNGLETNIAVNGKEISGSIIHLSMEIEPLTLPKVVITLAADNVSAEAIADIACETEKFVPHDIDGIRGWSLSSPTCPGAANRR